MTLYIIEPINIKKAQVTILNDINPDANMIAPTTEQVKEDVIKATFVS